MTPRTAISAPDLEATRRILRAIHDRVPLGSLEDVEVTRRLSQEVEAAATIYEIVCELHSRPKPIPYIAAYLQCSDRTASNRIRLAIAADNGSGVPDFNAPLYVGPLIDPTTTATWYYETGLNIPVVPGQKYYVLLDGYANAGATGNAGIGLSDTQPIPGEVMIWSNSDR